MHLMVVNPNAYTGLEMIDRGDDTREAVMKRLGLEGLQREITIPITNALKYLKAHGKLKSDLGDVLVKYPSLARGNYVFEYTPEAKQAFAMAFFVYRIPRLEGCVTSEEAADILGVSRTMVNRYMHDGTLKSGRRFGDAKPIFVISENEVRGLKAEWEASGRKKRGPASTKTP